MFALIHAPKCINNNVLTSPPYNSNNTFANYNKKFN